MKEAVSGCWRDDPKCATAYKIIQRALDLGHVIWAFALPLSKSTA